MSGPAQAVLVRFWGEPKPPEELRDFLMSSNQPVVLQGAVNSWAAALTWSPIKICTALALKRTSFKVCPKRGSLIYKAHFKPNDVIYETMCDYVEATFSDFLEWLGQPPSSKAYKDCSGDQDLTAKSVEYDVSGDFSSKSVSTGTWDSDSQPKTKRVKLDLPHFESSLYASESDQLQSTHSTTQAWHTTETIPHKDAATPSHIVEPPSSNPLMQYPRSDHWVYADYKYMSQLCSDMPELLSAIKWEVFGFPQLDGRDATLWVGSEGANTPCHYDTYGSNIVVQLSGRKKWLLFSPETSESMYPTRVPYEESSVFCSVDVSSPDLERFPKFATAKAYEVTLCAGDVLYVPRQWWHYVECLEPAVSVNTWLPLPTDVHERVKEAVVRTLVSKFASTSEEEEEETVTSRAWINPNEVVFPMKDNLKLLSLTLAERRRQLQETSGAGCVDGEGQAADSDCLTEQDFVDAIVSSGSVMERVAQALLKRC